MTVTELRAIVDDSVLPMGVVELDVFSDADRAKERHHGRLRWIVCEHVDGEGQRWFCVAMWRGKLRVPYARYAFKSIDEREAWIEGECRLADAWNPERRAFDLAQLRTRAVDEGKRSDQNGPRPRPAA